MVYVCFSWELIESNTAQNCPNVYSKEVYWKIITRLADQIFCLPNVIYYIAQSVTYSAHQLEWLAQLWAEWCIHVPHCFLNKVSAYECKTVLQFVFKHYIMEIRQICKFPNFWETNHANHFREKLQDKLHHPVASDVFPFLIRLPPTNKTFSSSSSLLYGNPAKKM